MRCFKLYIIVLCATITSCNFFGAESPENSIARVNGHYLTLEDLDGVVPEGSTKEDSILIVRAFMNRWAGDILLMDKALLNTSDKQEQTFNSLVEQYRNDLFTKAYLDALVKRNIDTSLTSDEANNVYESNKESFKLDNELLQLRYLSIRQNALNIDTIKERFARFDSNDKRYLDSIAVQFNSYSLNDSIWVRANQVIDKIQVVTEENKNQLLKKSNLIQLKDSLHLYLIQINDVLLRNDYAPLDYVKPTVKQIIINKRKLELIRQIENDIIKDAIKNKQFEVYK